jgi:hypothetical protein
MRYIRKQAQIEAFRIARVVKSGPLVDIKLEPDPRTSIFASGYDGWIHLPEHTQVVEGDYLARESSCPDFVIPQYRFDREYSVIGDGSTHSDEPLFPPPTEPDAQ